MQIGIKRNRKKMRARWYSPAGLSLSFRLYPVWTTAAAKAAKMGMCRSARATGWCRFEGLKIFYKLNEFMEKRKTLKIKSLQQGKMNSVFMDVLIGRGCKGRREADGASKRMEQLTGLKRMGSVHRRE
jgi:hypothetical protein